MESGMKKKVLLFAAAGVLALAACRDSDEDERAGARALAPSPQALAGDAASVKPDAATQIDAQQAIAAATAAVPGSAREVRLESRGGKPEYEVTVVPKGGNSRMRVDVDATSGQVLKSGRGTERDGDDDKD